MVKCINAIVGVLSFVVFLGLAGLNLAIATPPAAVVGDYVEARNCDVWTGPCFDNSVIRGNHAVVGWIVREGAWNGVSLDSLSIILVLESEGILSTKTEGKVRTIVFVDRKANAAQKKALISMVSKLAPRYVKNLAKVKRARIAHRREGFRASLEVGDRVEVKVSTRALNPELDKVCGSEEKAYDAFSQHTNVKCAKTLQHFYRGNDLEERWSDPNARSAMVGTFSL